MTEELTYTESLTDAHVLASIANGHLDHAALRSLPPWRAVLLARVACKAGAMTRADRDALVREVHLYGEVLPLRKPAGQLR